MNVYDLRQDVDDRFGVNAWNGSAANMVKSN
jgi:hypothetical protein